MAVAYSDVLVANMAMNLAGLDQDIEELDAESNDNAVKLLARWYPISLNYILEGYDWPLTTQQVELDLIEEQPTDEWGFFYERPVNCIVARRIVSGVLPETAPVPFKLGRFEGDLGIFTNQREAVLEFTGPLENVGEMMTRLALAVASHLCVSVAKPLKLSADVITEAKVQLREATALGQATAAQERQPPKQPLSKYIRARNAVPNDPNWMST